MSTDIKKEPNALLKFIGVVYALYDVKVATQEQVRILYGVVVESWNVIVLFLEGMKKYMSQVAS